MPISGTIPITGGQGIVPSGAWFLTGEDGNHYVVVGQQGSASPQIKLGCAETNSTVWTRTSAEWESDFNGEAAVGAPTAGASGMGQGPIPIPGTKYFYIPGKIGGGPPEWNIGVRYAIESSSNIVVDGIFAYATVDTPAGVLGTVWCFGANVVDDQLFAVCWLYNGIFDGNGRPYLVRLPLSYGENIVESTTSVWPLHRTSLHSAFGQYTAYFESGGQGYFNYCALLKYPGDDNLMILTYRCQDSLPDVESGLTTAGSEYVIVNYTAQSVGSLTSAQAALGQPWSDVALGYAGTTTSNNYFNDYSGPAINGNELIFARCFVDQPTIKQLRRFEYDETGGSFAEVDTLQVVIASGTASDRAVMVARDGDRLLAGSYVVSQWALGELSVPYITLGDCEGEDEADAPPTPETWPTCDLVPEDIDVQAVSETQTPGRSLGGRQQFVQRAAGHWRFELIGIPVWTKELALQWHALESKLDGRNGTILVPFYEAPLSGTPIVATAADAFYVGDVRLTIEQTAGATIRAGMHFSAGERGYRIKRVTGTAAGITSVVIWPPLRDVIAAEESLDFNDPVCRCRQERDDGMAIMFELLKFGKHTVAFVEDV